MWNKDFNDFFVSFRICNNDNQKLYFLCEHFGNNVLKPNETTKIK